MITEVPLQKYLDVDDRGAAVSLERMILQRWTSKSLTMNMMTRISLDDDDPHHIDDELFVLQITYCIADSAGGGLSLQAVTPTQPMPEEEEVDFISIIFDRHMIIHHMTIHWS